jgi:hypothetical protein
MAYQIATPKLLNARSDIEKSISMRRAYMDMGGAPGVGEINAEIRNLGRKNNWPPEMLAKALADPNVQSRVGLDISSQRLKRHSDRLYGAEMNPYQDPVERKQAHKKMVRIETGAHFEGENAYKNDLIFL